MIRAKQIGSGVSFAVIGVVLVVLMAGALYLATHHRNTQVAVQTPAVTLPTDTTPAPGTAPQTPATDDTQKSSSGSSSDSPSSSKKNTDSSKKDTKSTKEKNADAEQPTELSHTGPSDVALQCAMLGILVAIASAYLRSSRPAHL